MQILNTQRGWKYSSLHEHNKNDLEKPYGSWIEQKDKGKPAILNFLCMCVVFSNSSLLKNNVLASLTRTVLNMCLDKKSSGGVDKFR